VPDTRALVAGIHVFGGTGKKVVDGRDKPGHDDRNWGCPAIAMRPSMSLSDNLPKAASGGTKAIKDKRSANQV
jgi:hypothetical protein